MDTNINSTERVTDNDPTVHEPQVTWDQVYYADGVRANENLRFANRRQEAWEEDPEGFTAYSMESVDGWVGECAG